MAPDHECTRCYGQTLIISAITALKYLLTLHFLKLLCVESSEWDSVYEVLPKERETYTRGYLALRSLVRKNLACVDAGSRQLTITSMAPNMYFNHTSSNIRSNDKVLISKDICRLTSQQKVPKMDQCVTSLVDAL